MVSASGATVPAIARLVAADEDTVCDVVHAFNEKGLAALDPQQAGGRPRLITEDDVEFIVTAATTRPVKLGLPFTHWSLPKLAAYLAANPSRAVRTGRERLRQILHGHGISFQRTRTWKESADPDKDAKLDRIEHVTSTFPDRCFAFDQFGPLSIRPAHGSSWARQKETCPAAIDLSPHARDQVFPRLLLRGRRPTVGVTRRRKGGDHTLATLKSIRAARPDGAPIYVIMDNLPANKTPPSAPGRASTRSACVSRPPARRGPTRSRRSPGHCAPCQGADHPNHTVLARRRQLLGVPVAGWHRAAIAWLSADLPRQPGALRAVARLLQEVSGRAIRCGGGSPTQCRASSTSRSCAKACQRPRRAADSAGCAGPRPGRLPDITARGDPGPGGRRDR
jgi:transposase